MNKREKRTVEGKAGVKNSDSGAGPADMRAILEFLFKKLGMEEAAKRWRAVVEWDQIVGQRIAAASKAVSVRGKTLVVEVGEAIWANELNFLKKVIVDKINVHLCDVVIDDIYFKVARMKKPILAEKPSGMEQVKIQLSGEQKRALEAKIDESVKGALKEELKSLLLKIPLSANS